MPRGYYRKNRTFEELKNLAHRCGLSVTYHAERYIPYRYELHKETNGTLETVLCGSAKKIREFIKTI